MSGQAENPGSGLPEASQAQRQRILLLIEGSGNRRQVANQLAADHEVIEPEQDGFHETEFDLAIVDGPSLKRWHEALQEVKQRMEPVFLPVMLILQRHAVRRRADDPRDIVDDFIVAPIERDEFLERIRSLLRLRRYAVEQQKRLVFVAQHDEVTGLPTREPLLAHLQTSIEQAARTSQQIHLIVVHIPMERFIKSLGYHAVDEIAKSVTEIVGAVTARWTILHGEDYYVSRIATETGAIVVPPYASLEEVSHFCRELAAAIHEPQIIQNQQVRLQLFFGISCYPDDAEDAPGLLKTALGALGAAKVSGKPQYYSSDAQKQTLDFLRIEADLHRALEKDELELWFQPKFRLRDLAIVGAEALVRWRLPSGSLIPPGIFIPIAEKSGLIQKIDSWVIEKACQTLSRWRREELCKCAHVAVNVTPEDLASSNFVAWLKELLKKDHLPASALEIEMTETMLLELETGIREILADLRMQGVRVAIDDFGTGFSSLSYLQKMPADILKIDKSFVDVVPGDPGGEAITKAIVGLARQFGLELVAEGIETQNQLEYLNELGVESGQGYLVGRPLPEAEFIELVEKGLRIQ